MGGQIKQMDCDPPIDWSQGTVLPNVGSADLVCVYMYPDRSYTLYYLDYPEKPKNTVEVLILEIQTAMPVTIPDYMVIHGTLWVGITQYVVLKKVRLCNQEEEKEEDLR